MMRSLFALGSVFCLMREMRFARGVQRFADNNAQFILRIVLRQKR